MIFSHLLNMQSHPSWVCGLKPRYDSAGGNDVPSHPSWVCGLKQKAHQVEAGHGTSHPSWVCGLKHDRRVGTI